MLSEEIIEKLTERLVNRIEKGNAYTLEQIGKSIKKIGTLSPTSAQQLAQVLKYGGSYNKIVNKLAEITELNVKDIYKIFEEVAKYDYQFAKQFYDYRGIDYIPWEENKALQDQVKALATIAAKEYINLSNTLAFTSKDKFGHVVYTDLARTYQNAIDEAVLSVAQGKSTFEEQMYKVIKELGSSGLKTVDYANNRSMRLDSAVRMNMQGALRNLHNEIQQQFGEQFKADGIEISVHSNPAPDHAEAQGRQFSKEEYQKLQTIGVAKDYKNKEINLHRELKRTQASSLSFRPISKHNCYHYIFNIVLGVSQPQYTDKQLQQIIDDNNKGFYLDGKHYTNYEGTQLQRKLETEIRKWKDTQIIARASTDDDKDRLILEAQDKITVLTRKYKELSDVSGLPTRIERMRVSGYRKVKVKKPTPIKETKKTTSTFKGEAIEVFISKEENKRITDFFIEEYESQIKNDSFLRDFEKERYKQLLKEKEKGYKDETIKLDSIENCNKLLNKVNTEITGDEIRNTDFRLVAEASQTLYSNSIKSPAIMSQLKFNRAWLQAEKNTNGVANTRMSRITLNNRYYDNYDKLYKTCTDNQKNHEYLSGNSYRWWSEVAKGNETKEVITHEFGHRLHSEISSSISFNRTGHEKAFEYFYQKYGDTDLEGRKYIKFGSPIRRDLIYEPIRRLAKKKKLTQKEIIEKYVSGYGKKDYDEMFAEVFANSQLGKSNALGDELINFLIEIGEWII